MSATRKFRAWWKSSGLSQEDVAAKIGVSQGQVSRLLKGTRTHPDAYVAARIEDLTGGEVKASSWPRRARRVAKARRSSPERAAAREIQQP